MYRECTGDKLKFRGFCPPGRTPRKGPSVTRQGQPELSCNVDSGHSSVLPVVADRGSQLGRYCQVCRTQASEGGALMRSLQSTLVVIDETLR